MKVGSDQIASSYVEIHRSSMALEKEEAGAETGLCPFDLPRMCIAYASTCTMAYFFLVKRNELHPGQSPGGELGELPTACHDNPCRCQNDPGLHQNSLNASRLAWSGAGQRYSTRLKFDICCTTSSSSLLCLCFCLACISALVPAFLPLSFIIRKAINVFVSSSCQIMSC